jgi:hypothetical protein
MTFPRPLVVAGLAALILAACRETAGPVDVTPVPTKLDLGILWWAIAGTSDGGFVARTGSAVNRYTRDGNLLWSTPNTDVAACPTDPPCTTAVDEQDNIYVPLYRGLISLNASGVQRWRVPLATGGTVAVGSDDRVYASTITGGFTPQLTFALNKSTGDIVWQIPGAVSFLLLDEARKILYAFSGGVVRALDPSTGAEKWRLPPPYNGRFAALGSDGTLYVANSSLTAVLPSGVVAWSVSLPSNTSGTLSPVIDDDGTIVVAYGNRVTAFNPDGSSKWDYVPQILGSAAPTSPAIDAAHNVYIVQYTGRGYSLVQINNGALRREVYAINDPHGRAVLIAKDGRVFFNAISSIVFFDTSGPTRAVWSQMGGGPGRTERR